ncbi:MAG: hypothetical protein AB1500_10590 [Bacillota bacterium]
MADSTSQNRPVGKFILYAVLSIALYALFFLNAETLQDYLAKGGIIKASIIVGIAICVSLIYGNFAGTFWEVIGIQGKKH